ncbi:hypothetical protein EAH85_12570 [Curtobacterium flaccumfaciens]|nr:hypothetical protein EAH85_12570 [Curtobacterium flaccumfaciens]
MVDLLHRVETAGGRLDVDDRGDDIDYRKLVWRFNKSEYRPRGKELQLSYPGWFDQNQLRLEYRDWFWDLVEAPEVQAVASKSHLGPLAKAFLESKGDQFVTKESLPRAARIIESIVRHAAKVGIATRDPRAVDERTRRNGGTAREWSGHIELELDEMVQRLQVRELPGRGGDKFDYYQDGEFDRKRYDQVQRLPLWQRNRNYWFVPTGKLEVRAARPGFSFDGRKWSDTKSLSTEDRLGEVFRFVEVSRLEARAARQRADAIAERKERDREAAMTQARVLFRAAQEEALLLEQASVWRRHQEVRAFVDELQRRDDGSDEALQVWIATGERVAARLDVFKALSTPAFPAPSAEDIRPFLDGRNPKGPDRR